MAFLRDPYLLGFFLSVLIFLSFQAAVGISSDLSQTIQISGILEAVLFICYAMVYLSNRAPGSGVRMALKIFLALGIANLVVVIAGAGALRVSVIEHLLSFYRITGIYFVLLIPLVFLIFFGTYLRRKKYIAIGYLLFAVAIALLCVLFLSGLILNHYKIDDELYISFIGMNGMLHGVDPYAASLSSAIFSNATDGTISSITITTSNRIIGTLNYPSLYLLSLAPFYFASPPTLQNLSGIDLKLQTAAFLLLLLLAIAFSLGNKVLAKPQFALMFFIAAAVGHVASITTLLMLALLVVAYSRLESKWSWLLLGLCISIQEELWLPVLLLIAYSFNNYGLGKGLRDVFGAGAVFLVLNAYFILISPSAFFSSVLGPIQQMLIPNAISPFGYALVTFYQMPLGSFGAIFALAVLGSLLAFLYLNRKALIGLFAMVPLLFLSHSNPIYYTFFAAFLVATVFIEDKKIDGTARRYLRGNGWLLGTMVVVLMATTVGFVYLSHLSYLENFNMTASNSSLQLLSGHNESIYTATLHYKNLSNGTVYMMLFGAYDTNMSAFGLLGQRIAENASDCTDYPCAVNPNVFTLQANRTLYRIRARIPWPSGQRIYAVRPVVYNSAYYYTPGVLIAENSSSQSQGPQAN
ncbi:MAG: hypothetical protein KGH61_00900 [Candidatus Micrarchaeota archaeon]|nr:hypothetical protein [Candidatus Micrarchaeota archaeon]MDE1847492.1 hypothetical protein [Candidatus Micrarchaeota archaeon]MDE1863872.1 hypothetical protein [Candidatus Micrarchaeota archaeon]